jgi:hypothetical protein
MAILAAFAAATLVAAARGAALGDQDDLDGARGSAAVPH